MMDPILVVKTVEYIVRKKRQMTNKLYGANGGWAAIRSVNYNGICQVYGEDYHQVTPVVSHNEWNKMMCWVLQILGPCSHEKGPGVWTPNQRWYANNSKFLFKEQKDLEWFLLRWQ